MPRRQARGGAWEPVPGDIFQGQVYYRQQLAGPNLTPENYTVLVGERWVATMETKEYMEIKFYADIRQQIPPFLQEVFPYRLVWGFLVDETENYIGGLEHESFHALQGSLAGERLAEAEYANQNESQYPWDDTTLDKLWQQEMDLLVQAVQADTTEQAAELGRQFLVQRDARRAEDTDADGHVPGFTSRTTSNSRSDAPEATGLPCSPLWAARASPSARSPISFISRRMASWLAFLDVSASRRWRSACSGSSITAFLRFREG